MESGIERMAEARPSECETCEFFPIDCHYWNNEGADLRPLIYADGRCSKRKPIEPSTS